MMLTYVTLALTVCLSLGATTAEAAPAPDCPPAQPNPNVSDCVGTIPALLANGYRFMTGSDLGAQQSQQVPTSTTFPPTYDTAKYNTGTLYLQNAADILICSYTVVTANPLVGTPPAGNKAVAQSKCYRIK